MKSFYRWVNDHILPSEINTSSSPKDISPSAYQQQDISAGAHVVALSLTKAGDALADVKLMLPWLLHTLGAPVGFIGWLVPLREALALLPQLLFAHWIEGLSKRKGLWSLGSVIQGITIFLMGCVPLANAKGETAGWIVLGLLTLFSLARCLCSIVIKDVQGKTIDKQRRGSVSGVATSIAGVGGIAFAAALMLGWLSESNQLAVSIVLMVAGCLWLIAAMHYCAVPEEPDAEAVKKTSGDRLLHPLMKLLQDRHLVRFLITRSLFISTALVAPFYVILANQYSAGSVTALGVLILLTGLANLLSGRFWGLLSDISSRRVLVITGALCGILALLVNAGLHWQLPYAQSPWWYGAVIFVLYIGHAGVRLGRTTYLMDMANAGNRAKMVALSNTIIGIVLLAAGSAFAVLGNSSVELAILVLGITSLLAALMAWRLPEVSHAGQAD
ncbi:MAG: MFS transporter [Pseudomonadales bacterium]|nr:MFS transporter [Pseudomonadales bacterium]